MLIEIVELTNKKQNAASPNISLPSFNPSHTQYIPPNHFASGLAIFNNLIISPIPGFVPAAVPSL